MSSPLVSVVMATNRTSPFLIEALRSVGAQTHDRVEVIVVDDGSPEPGRLDEVVADALPYARVVHRSAAGVSAARNSGAEVAEGEYLVFLDDDDRWHPGRLAAQVACLRREPAAVASYCGMRTIDAEGEVLIDADQVAVTGYVDIAARRTGIILPNLLLRTEAFRAAGGFDPGIRLAEDLDLLLVIARSGSVIFEPRALVDYRTHGANTTGRHRELVRSIDQVLRKHRRIAEAENDSALVLAFDESLRRNARFAWWGAGRAARASLSSGHPFSAASELLWALHTAPTGLVDGVMRRLRGSSGAA